MSLQDERLLEPVEGTTTIAKWPFMRYESRTFATRPEPVPFTTFPKW
jgi:hypothetical protein